MNLYIKTFLIGGIPTGTLAGIVGVIYTDFYTTLQFFSFGFLAGGGLFLSVSIVHTLCVIKIHPENFAHYLGVHHEQSFSIQLPTAYAYTLCVDSLHLFGTHKIEKNKDEEKEKKNEIRVSIAPTLISGGEVLTFIIRDIDDYTSEIHVSSDPPLKTVIIDFGKNLKNIQKISKFFEERGATIIE
jgi:hypothetical protein